MTAVRLEGVSVRAGASRILDDVTLDVSTGAVLAVVGPNGSGKTTLLDVIGGEMRPTHGRVHVVANGGIGRVFQDSPFPRALGIEEIAALATRDRDGALRLLERVGLGATPTVFAHELSTGMRRIFDLALALAGDPALLLLDEPSSGLARAEVDRLAALLRAWHARTGATIVLVEHDRALVSALAGEVVAMQGGRIVARGTPAALATTPPMRAERTDVVSVRETLERIWAR